jgi:anti-sigma factor RsiW
MLPAYAGESGLPLTVRRHLARCEGCREELAEYRTMSAGLGALPAVGIDPPPGLKAALVAIPSQSGKLQGVRSHLSRNKKTYAGVAVAAAGAAGAALWRNRRHRLATA